MALRGFLWVSSKALSLEVSGIGRQGNGLHDFRKLRNCTKIMLTFYNDNKLKYFNYIN